MNLTRSKMMLIEGHIQHILDELSDIMSELYWIEDNGDECAANYSQRGNVRRNAVWYQGMVGSIVRQIRITQEQVTEDMAE